MISLFLNPVIFALRRRLRWGRKNYFEKPIGADFEANFEANFRIEELKKKYGVAFENRLNAENSLQNYVYLDVLDQVFTQGKVETSRNPRVLDVGSKNFYYAQALQAFFKPSKLTGLEIDAYRLYTNLQTRFSAAQFYIQTLPNATYEVGSFLKYAKSTQVLLLFYPFVTSRETLRWGLPYDASEVEAYFKHAAQILEKNGICFMVNHGEDEWILANAALQSTPLILQIKMELKNPLDDRKPNPICSVWKKLA